VNDSFSNQVIYSRSFPLPRKVKASEGSVEVFFVSEGMQQFQKNNISELDAHTISTDKF
jgi:predicted peroxiredoxin